jgi:hypothetical protein
MTGTVAARLSAQTFFAGLTDSQRGALAEDGTAVTFAAGERLFDEGGIADMFWLIEQGGIALDMRVPGRGDQIVETLGPGTVLGWSWLHRPYRWFVAGRLDLDDQQLTWQCEQAIRNYDPCISCATHFLDLTVDRA